MMKNKIQSILIGAAISLVALTTVSAQEGAGERLTIPLTDPSKPAVLRANVVQGGITVKGYDGAEIVIEGLPRAKRAGKAKRKDKEEETEDTQGLRRIDIGATGITATEEDNVVKVTTGSPHRAVDLTIQVPRSTSLKLEGVINGDIAVEGVSGEIEASNVNGGITVTDVAGSVVANTVNGPVNVSFTEVTSDKLMSFTSLNGKVDVTFPPSVRANVRLETQNGEIYTDFDIQMEATPRASTVEESGSEGRGRHRVRTESAAYGKINGGGPEFSFKTHNGNIYIRQMK